ncbi:hypothetical protein H310_09480 [Aphanomyces invadans]|uniref:Uncharacterized protein n=1 Tax=Aphanomyces invadans TaxID=157072 RepID=A0A024TTT1_9STRA|nr:hypothetical protein H310_09480 [Aphanomyces invadans]ETV97580.1 hypothetical protein H310_09480 [Aphanomyces invadans]|eukprot:XP_008873789.1 hypothetical protein H310_09480 [Aphanomyces invadans]
MDVPALVDALVTSLHGSPNVSLMSLSLRILSSRYGNAHDVEYRANDMMGVTQKIIRHLKESSIGYDPKLAVQRFESLNQDFITHGMLHRKAALLTVLLRLSLDTDSTTLYVPPLPAMKLGQPVKTDPTSTSTPHNAPYPSDPSMPSRPSTSSWHDKHMQQESYRAAVRKHDTGAAIDIPEAVLLQEVLYAFQGIDSKYIFYNPSIDRFEVARHVGVSLPMRDLIRKLTEVGWLYNRIQQFLARSAMSSDGVVIQSFHHALKAELSDFYRLIAILSAQVDLDAGKYPLPESAGVPDLTLKRLIVWTQDPLDRLRVMAALVDSVDGLVGGALASGIYLYMEHGDPFVRQFIATILNQVATPLLNMIQKWTLEGMLDDTYEEFFVACDATVDDDFLWSQKYSLRWSMLPQFIPRDVANTIFVMGKSINFIRTCCGDSEWTLDTQLRTSNLTFDHWMEFQQWITAAAKETNNYVTQLLLNKHQLLEHCRALKQYLLLGQGDFIQYLMDLLQPELSKRATQIYRHNLMSVLETALNASNAKFETSDILSRLDVKLHQASSGEEGWDVFALHYKLQAPLNTVIPDASMSEYLRMFSFLFKVKRVEYSLSTCWGRDMNLVHLISKKLPHAWAVLHQGNLLRSEMIHFTTNLHNYMMFEVLDGSWHSFVHDVQCATHLDGLIDAHSAYLQRIQSNAFMLDENQNLVVALKGIFETILKFSKVQEAIYTTAVREGQLYDRQERMSQTTWGITDDQPRAKSALDGSGALVKQMQTIATDYHAQIVAFLDLLKQQALGSDNLPYLTFRLDFNEYYRKSTSASDPRV